MLSLIYPFVVNPIAACVLLWRWLRGRDDRRSLGERLCVGNPPGRADIWLHAASVGEISGVHRLISYLCKDRNVLLTVQTVTARDIALNWHIPGLVVRLAPLDALGSTGRFLRWARPRLYVSVEQEFLPTRFRQCKWHNIPVLGLSTRVGNVTALARACLVLMDQCWPMDQENAQRILQSGIATERVRLPFNPKLALSAPEPTTDPDPALRNWTGAGARIVLAASTHVEDEMPLAEAISEFLSADPLIRLIVAPRHPERSQHLLAAFTAKGLRAATRSRKEVPEWDKKVYVADTLGEMPKWYSVASITLICGSFSDRGGHTPVEAVEYGSFPVFGPDMNNHLAARQLLIDAGGAREISAHSQLQALLDVQDWPALCRHGAGLGRAALAAHRSQVIAVEQEILDHINRILAQR